MNKFYLFLIKLNFCFCFYETVIYFHLILVLQIICVNHEKQTFSKSGIPAENRMPGDGNPDYDGGWMHRLSALQATGPQYRLYWPQMVGYWTTARIIIIIAFPQSYQNYSESYLKLYKRTNIAICLKCLGDQQLIHICTLIALEIKCFQN